MEATGASSTLQAVATVSAGACDGGDDDSAERVPAGIPANTPAREPAETAPTSTEQTAESLPSTASPVPLAAVVGIVTIGAAALLRRYRR